VYSGNPDHQGFQSHRAGEKSLSCFENPCIAGSVSSAHKTEDWMPGVAAFYRLG
jgi:hypothetical protein